MQSPDGGHRDLRIAEAVGVDCCCALGTSLGIAEDVDVIVLQRRFLALLTIKAWLRLSDESWHWQFNTGERRL